MSVDVNKRQMSHRCQYSTQHITVTSPLEAALVLGSTLAVHHTVAVILALVEGAVVGEDPVLVVELPLAGPALAVHCPLEVGAIPIMVGQH